MDEYKGLLKAAFAETDTIAYGPFTVTKAPGTPWKQARVLVDGADVTLPASKKQYLALLISQQGQNVTLEDFSAAVPQSNASRWYAIAKTRDDHVEMRGARKELINTIKVTVSQLKSALKDQGIPSATLDMIAAASPYRVAGEKGRIEENMAGAYRLRLTPDA